MISVLNIYMNSKIKVLAINEFIWSDSAIEICKKFNSMWVIIINISYLL